MQSIKKIREMKKLSQVEVAKRIGTDTQNYHRLEKRGKKLTIEQLESIADALDVPIFFILFDEESDEKLIERDKKLDSRIEEQTEMILKMRNELENYEERMKNMKEMVDLMLSNRLK